MAKELKEIITRELEKAFGPIDGCILIDFRSINSEQTQDLRSSLRKSGVRMNVIQNRLARRVFAGRGAPPAFQDSLRGPTAVLFGPDGAVSASKSIVQWRKKNKDLAPIKGGLFQGKALTSAEVESLAALPGLEELRSSLLSLFLSPLTHLASVTQSLLSNFPGATKAHREGLEKGGGGGGA